MFEITKEQRNKLDAMPFLEYAQTVRERIKHISNSNGYWEGMEWVKNVIERFKKEYKLSDENYHNDYLGDMFRSNLMDLKDYGKYHKSDKGKANTISQFKKDMEDHLTQLIYRLESPKQ